MNKGIPWHEVKEHPGILDEMRESVPEMLSNPDMAGLFRRINEDGCVQRFALSLSRMNLRNNKVRISQEWSRFSGYYGQFIVPLSTLKFELADSNGDYKSEIYHGPRRYGEPSKSVGIFSPDSLFLTKACYTLVSHSPPEVRAHFEGAILQMSDIYEEMARIAERKEKALVRTVYPVLNTRIKTLMLSSAEKGIYSLIPPEIWLLIKSMVGWDVL